MIFDEAKVGGPQALVQSTFVGKWAVSIGHGAKSIEQVLSLQSAVFQMKWGTLTYSVRGSIGSNQLRIFNCRRQRVITDF
jgi:hypothetical protein